MIPDYKDIEEKKITTETLLSAVDIAAQKKVKEIVENIEQLKTTRPEYESDAYDDGLKDMKRTILQLIR